MAKKFVRGITGVKNINKQGLDTNNVNDLLSDGEHNYIHRKKKDKTEEYHNLTNNLKTIEATNNGLLTVKNENNTKNKATLTVHHDPQKEQKLYSTDGTIDIVHGDNGTGEFTNVDVDPKKVLTHENLVSNSDYITLSHNGNSNKTEINTDALDSKISELEENGGGGQKEFQDTASIAVVNNGTGLRLKYFDLKTYSNSDCKLVGYGISVGDGDDPNTTAEIYKFTLTVELGCLTGSFTLDSHDYRAFDKILKIDGGRTSVNINGVVFSMQNSVLTFTTDCARNNHYSTSFSTLITTTATPKNALGDEMSVENTDEIVAEKTDEIVADKGIVTKGGKE